MLEFCLLSKTEPQRSQSIDGSTDKRWEIGEGFMHLDNMYLVRLESVSRVSFQPEIWVADPSQPSIHESRPTTTSPEARSSTTAVFPYSREHPGRISGMIDE